MSTHPDWLTVGSTVTLRRTNASGRVVYHEAEVVVTRHTKASVFVTYPGSETEERFAAKGGTYVEVPAYLDQPTRLIPPTEMST